MSLRIFRRAQKKGKNGNLQKIQLITCKNSSRKAVKSRVPRSYRRNESMPEIPKRKREHQIYPREESPDMLMLDLFLAHLKTMRSCQKNMGLSYRCFELRRDTWNE